MRKYDVSDVKQEARGQWPDILAEVGGLDPAVFDGRHHPCPKCGGKDRFRFIDDEAGAVFCNQCFATENGDGLAAIQWLLDCDFPTALTAVAEYLRLEGRGSAKTVTTAKRKVVDTYDYRDQDGNLCYQSVRSEPKGFHLRRLKSDGNYDYSVKGVKRVLYRLPGILEGDPTHPVFIVEGEKDADRLAGIGCIATTNVFGAGKWRKDYASCLSGRSVVILPDNDDAGQKHAQQVAASLHGIAKSVKVVELPGLPAKGDVSDWLDAGHTLVELWEIVLATPERKPESATEDESLTPAEAEPPKRFKSFPVDALPKPLARFARAASEAIGCPLCFVVLPLLAVAAAMIGTSRVLELKRGWQAPSILWTAIVGESGTQKTPAMKLVLRPVKRREHKAMKRHAEALKDFDSQLAAYDKAMSAWKRNTRSDGLPPERPVPPEAERCIVSDTTVEALAPLLQANPRGLSLISDELSGWLGSFDKYSNGKGGDAANWLSTYSGEAITVDRKGGQPKTIFVPVAAVSITGGIQPGVLHRALGVENRENGLLARLLLASPPRRKKRWSEAEIDEKAEREYANLIDRLAALEVAEDEDGEPCPVVLRLTPEAKAAWLKFYDSHATEQAKLTGDLAAAWSKLEEVPARLAIVFHCVQGAVAASPAKPWTSDSPVAQSSTDVGAATMEAAIRVTEWFKREVRRVYAILSESDEQREQRELVERVVSEGGSITARELMHSCRRYRPTEVAEEAIDMLVSAGLGKWEDVSPSEKGGRPTRRFVLNQAPPKPP